MFILLTYDIDFKDKNCNNRLRKVSKVCESYGIRVQNSVFELTLDWGEFLLLKNKLKEIINHNDSIRFYLLGNNYKNKLEVIGKEEIIEISKDSCFIL